MHTSDHDIVISRTVSAPRDKVWEAFTKPEHIAQWWGPNGFTNTIHEMDVRPGGVWRFLMHGPDGTDYPNKITYEEVRKPEFLSYIHTDDKDSPEETFHATATFEEEDNLEGGPGAKTKVTLRLTLATKEDAERKKKFGAVEGGKQTMARLDAYVSKM